MENDLLVQMGKRISKRRSQLHMTQEELAERAGITPQTVSTAELGKKALRPENIVKICGALGISTDYLLLGTVAGEDIAILAERISGLSTAQYRYLESIISSYVAALNDLE